MKILASFIVLFMLLTPINSAIGIDIQLIAGLSNQFGDPVLRHPDFATAVIMSEQIVINSMRGKFSAPAYVNLRNFRIAQAVIGVYKINPYNLNTRSYFFEMMNLYIRKAESLALQRNRRFFTPQQRGFKR